MHLGKSVDRKKKNFSQESPGSEEIPTDKLDMEDTGASAKEQKQHKPLHADVSLHKTVA